MAETKLLDKLASLQKKWLENTTYQDAYELIWLYTTASRHLAKTNLEITNLVNQIKQTEAENILLLKDEKVEWEDSKWNPKIIKYTELEIKAKVQQILYPYQKQLSQLRFTKDMIEWAVNSIQMYLPIIRDYQWGAIYNSGK